MRMKTLLLMQFVLAYCSAEVGAGDDFSKALSLFNKQSYQDALQLLSACKVSGGRESERIYYCALCYQKMGQEVKASESFERVCKSFPDTKAAVLSRRYLDAALKSSPPSQAKTQVATPMPTLPEQFAVPFLRTSKGQIAVDGLLHGHSMRMIFDTGAEECLFGRNHLASVNLSGAERRNAAVLNSVSGPLRVFQVVSELKLGKLERKMAFSVQDQDMEMGILGQPFLQGYDYVVDNQAGLIRFSKSGVGGKTLLDSFAVPFREAGDKFIVSAQLNGRHTEMCFDTGAFGVCLSKKQSEEAGLRLADAASVRTSGPNGSQVDSWDTTADLSLGPIKNKSCPVRVIDCDTQYPLLGLNFFGRRMYSIDRARKEIHFAR